MGVPAGKEKQRRHQEKRFWDRVARRYDGSMGPRYHRVVAMTVSGIEPGDKVLEIATGTGLVAFEAAKTAREVIGVDISRKMIDEAENKKKAGGISNIIFQVEDAYKTPFKDGSFDAVICCNMLHIVQDPDIVLGEARRVLKPNGRLMASTYCHAEPTTFTAGFFLSVMWFLHKIGRIPYLHRFKIEDIEDLIEKSGYKIKGRERIKDEHPVCLYIEAGRA
ncbi:MAG: methyltransferase domain-containing protein [Thermodesulfobacteriota bacterium]|nr:methyltransferase domain-containing protein [Thermodesulfobacteriota bacterium]